MTISAKTCLVCTSMQFEKTKISKHCKIIHTYILYILQRKICKFLIKSLLRELKLKLIKTIYYLIFFIYYLIHLLIKSSKLFSFVSVVLTICMSHSFAYGAVDINKTVIISSINLSSYAYSQVTTELKLYSY